MKTYLQYAEKKKKEAGIRNDFMKFVKHVWPDFIEGSTTRLLLKNLIR